MHPARLQQLTHGRIDEGNAGAPLLPGGEAFGVITPGQGGKVPIEGLVARNPGIAHQDMAIEFAPQQFSDPGSRTLATTTEQAVVGVDRGLQALPWCQHSCIQIGRQLTGTWLERDVPGLVIVFQIVPDEGLQPLERRLFTRRPQLSHLGRCLGEAVDPGGQLIRLNGGGLLPVRRRQGHRQARFQARKAGLPELPEDLEIATALGQYRTGGEQGLVQIAVGSEACLLERLSHGVIPGGFVHPVFVVEMQVFETLFPGQVEQHLGRLLPALRTPDQQRDAQCLERLAQLGEVAQPEVDLDRSLVMFLPLGRTQQKDGDDLSLFSGSMQGGMVMGTQVGTKPDELAHA